ncbi:metallophosphoesterase [Sediminibacillus dalangtanensis]|uniref:Metallophosphoesterase n=2 Tax=Sediminibacillus dalangtanensis TaxID=2729421 RepID=A0ABX7VPQ3_9BACI|nr:metallophosphoesterase [Sediminibacillus dalangtanensis]
MLLLLIAVVTLLTAIGMKAYQNTKHVVINTLDLGSAHNTKQESPLQILHLSDLHLENISISPQQLYEKLKDEPIDLIALTGDFLDRKRTIPKLEPYLQKLNHLKPTYGMYAVFGNHDYVLNKESFQDLREVLEANDCTVLQNENRTIFLDEHPLHIIGIDDYGTGHSELSPSFKGIGDGYRLVLTHDPNVVLEMEDYAYDYLLSGHFHGGQILYPKAYHLVKMGKLVRMNMIKGLHQHHGRKFYISEGLGQTGLNIRIGSRPEITIHRVQSGLKAIQEKAVG